MAGFRKLALEDGQRLYTKAQVQRHGCGEGFAFDLALVFGHQAQTLFIKAIGYCQFEGATLHFFGERQFGQRQLGRFGVRFDQAPGAQLGTSELANDDHS